MSEFIKRLDHLFTKLNHTALLVEQSLADAIFAVGSGSQDDAEIVVQSDEIIDRREVEIERECIRLLALYQPAAIDLRRICFIIKANNDLERIADFCVNIAKMVPVLQNDNIAVILFPAFQKLSEQVADALHQTIRLFAPNRDMSNSGAVSIKVSEVMPETMVTHSIEVARSIITTDIDVVDVTFREYMDQIFSEEVMFQGKLNALYALTSIGRALERIGDLCTNIAEDAIFLHTGEIIRHGGVS